ncbi:MAG: MotA/TolQ/ExbB proton channel family protein [Planctomycetota bacterium]|nr:MotA/TolQ/ExbB proton channel family protein [Planctomycetota bacterium]
MSGWRGAACCLLALAALRGGEAAVAAAAARAQQDSERALAELRARIIEERTALMQRLQQAIAEGQQRRAELAALHAESADLQARAAAREAAESERRQRLEALCARLAPNALAPPLAERAAAAAAALAARTAALDASCARRLDEAPVIGRDGRLATVPVLHLGAARAVALGDGSAQRGCVQRSADGRAWVVVGPPLPASVLPGSPEPAIALDVSGQGALRAGAAPWSLRDWLAAGRTFIWPIIAVFAVGAGIALHRAWQLWRDRAERQLLAEARVRWQRGEAAALQALVAQRQGPLARVLGAGLEALAQPPSARQAALEAALLRESSGLQRGLTALAVLATVAPLLGLLGTVTGMIEMFGALALHGSGQARALSGGISEALVCTQAGMLAAIPLLLAHAALSRWAERRALLLEEAATLLSAEPREARDDR